MGYDVETADIEADERVEERHWIEGERFVAQFVRSAIRVHETLEAPCTLYLTGRTLRTYRHHVAALKSRPVFDIQSHTFDHIRFKTVMDRTLDGRTVLFEGGTPLDIAVSVARNRVLIEEVFQTECRGITTPWTYFKGLNDRTDLLAILQRENVKFVRSYGRNSEDKSPVALEVQPYWYEAQGFPEMLEMMVHGWIDVHYRRQIGYENMTGYVEEVKRWIDRAVEENRDLSWCQHDWSSVLHDPDMNATYEIVRYAKEKGCTLCSGSQYYAYKQKTRDGGRTGG